jgi:hypothetical protein
MEYINKLHLVLLIRRTIHQNKFPIKIIYLIHYHIGKSKVVQSNIRDYQAITPKTH